MVKVTGFVGTFWSACGLLEARAIEVVGACCVRDIPTVVQRLLVGAPQCGVIHSSHSSIARGLVKVSMIEIVGANRLDEMVQELLDVLLRLWGPIAHECREGLCCEYLLRGCTVRGPVGRWSYDPLLFQRYSVAGVLARLEVQVEVDAVDPVGTLLVYDIRQCDCDNPRADQTICVVWVLGSRGSLPRPQYPSTGER